MASIVPFPRSIERGLIEAAASSARSGRRDTFPRSIERGLIEAKTRRRTMSSALGSFPRSIERGLIEAS